MNDRQYYIYIMANYKNTTIYAGMTNDLERRVYEHKNKLLEGFTSRYNLKKLVYYEIYNEVYDAIVREKQIKSWSRKRKDDLVNGFNESWQDLSEGWTDCHVGSIRKEFEDSKQGNPPRNDNSGNSAYNCSYENEAKTSACHCEERSDVAIYLRLVKPANKYKIQKGKL